MMHRQALLLAIALPMLGLIITACVDAIPSQPSAMEESYEVKAAACGWMRWTQEPLDLEAWFDQHPETAALHRWHSPSGTFQSARRDSMLEAQFDKLQLTMVVWRESQTEGMPTTINVENARGLIQLRRGMNLVRWWGREGSSFTIREAFRWIGPSIESIVRFDSQSKTCHRDIGSDSTQPQDLAASLTRGDLLAINMREDATWTQSWIWSPNYASFGELGNEAHVELSEQVREVSGFIAARYGLVASSYVVMLLSDVEALTDPYEALTGQELDISWWPDFACGVAWSGGIGLLADCRDPIAFDHEFVHVIQAQLANGEIGSSWETEPAWLIEGAAEYISARYRHEQNYQTYSNTRKDAIEFVRERQAQLALDRLESREDFREIEAVYTYALGMLAAEWLAAHAGDDALFSYMRQLSSVGTKWDLAFERSFGLSVEEFYEQFEQYSVDFDEPRPHLISGRLLDNSGSPVRNVKLYAYPSLGGRGLSADTDADGHFAIDVRAGSYRIAIHSESSCTTYGYVGRNGDLTTWSDAVRIKVGAADSQQLAVQIPDSPSRLRGWSTCSEAEGKQPIRGRVLSPDGEGVEDVSVFACADGACARSVTSETGAFSIDTPDQSVLLLAGPGDSLCDRWGTRGPDGELIPFGQTGSVVEVQRRARRVDIHLPAPAEELKVTNVCW